MTKLVILDSGPLGIACNALKSNTGAACNTWIRRLRRSGINVAISSLSDFEVRRELVRANRVKSINVLERVIRESIYLPVTQEVIAQAAVYWAESRNLGRPTADPFALDADVLIAAQAACLSRLGASVVVATLNAAHIGRYVRALNWTEIKAEEI